jgi:transcriptional regulator with XRE-family HTH domain
MLIFSQEILHRGVIMNEGVYNSVDLASRLKYLRTTRGMSVRSLAKEAGVTASFIYQIENKEAAPSLSTLKRIAKALEVSASFFIEDEVPEEWFIQKAAARKKLITGLEGLNVELFTFAGPRAKRMEASIVKLEPKASADRYIYNHSRDDFIYVLKGAFEFKLDWGWFRLEEGDAMHLSIQNPSAIRNPGEQEAIALWVVSPTSIEQLLTATEKHNPREDEH